MKYDHDAIRAEIEKLRVGGVIRPGDVVEAARDEKSPMHDWFEWDDTEAAREYRLNQARGLLRVYVQLDANSNETVNAFVSLTTDRVNPGGGYRALEDVLANVTLSQQLLEDAFRHLRSVQSKYRHLRQLAGVWSAVDAAETAEEEARQEPIAA